jgi:predicted AlkP superfamily phosphohydrolase/phosphomutase
MILMDSADGRLVRRWTAAGELPVLAALAERGASLELESIASRFPDAVWPTLNTGSPPGTTGHYNWRCVRPGTDAMVFAPNRSRRRTFWELAHDAGRPILVADIPRSVPIDAPDATVLVGWGQRAATRHESSPPGLYAEVERRHGRYPRWLDDGIRRSLRGTERYNRTLNRMVDRRTAMLQELIERAPWDLAFLSYPEGHNAGHIHHRHLEPGEWPYDERFAARFGDRLLASYRAIDAGIGELIARVPDVDVMVLSGHGMAVNTSGFDLLPRLLARLGYTTPSTAPPATRALAVARSALPWSIRRHVNARLPLERRTQVMADIFRGAVDWTRTRAVAEAEAGHAWVRVNLRGREPHGIVEPGEEYERLRDELIGDLRALVDADTGQPAAAEVLRREEVVSGPHSGDLPDVFCLWQPGRLLRAAVHPRAGEISERLRDVPWTEHHDDGFLIAAGPSIRSGAEAAPHIIDVAPTALALMGVPIPDDMTGRPIESLLGDGVEPPRRTPVAWERDPWAAEPAV